MPIPNELYQKLLDYYREHAADARLEVEEGYIDGPDNRGSMLLELPLELRQRIHNELQSVMEKWCDAELVPTFIYGIRTYLDQAVLKPHRDRVDTHIISAILNIDQHVREDWPLVIDDHYYRTHHVHHGSGRDDSI